MLFVFPIFLPFWCSAPNVTMPILSSSFEFNLPLLILKSIPKLLLLLPKPCVGFFFCSLLLSSKLFSSAIMELLSICDPLSTLELVLKKFFCIWLLVKIRTIKISFILPTKNSFEICHGFVCSCLHSWAAIQNFTAAPQIGNFWVWKYLY